MTNIIKLALAVTVAVMASLGCNAQLVIRPSDTHTSVTRQWSTPPLLFM